MVKAQKVAPKKRKFKSQQELFKAMLEWVTGPYRERMLNDPEFRKKDMEMCGYRKDKDGNVYVVPV